MCASDLKKLTSMEVFVKSAWESLCTRYTTNKTLVAQLWHELKSAYTAKSRHYHTLDHIAYMLKLAERHKPESRDFDLLLFAIFYHDVVYSATRSDNEVKSAALAVTRLQSLGVPECKQEMAREMILATKSHQTSPHSLTNLLIDLDLAILGADQERYDWYSQGVRKEYSIYPDLLYKPGRRKVLQHFLEQPHIYKTPAFREFFEEKARENLQRELTQYS